MQHHNLTLESAGAELVRRLGGIWRGGSGMCRCPAHDDRSPSLSVRVGHTSLLFKCFAGCDTVEVLREIRRFEPDALDAVGDGQASPDETEQWLQDRARDLWGQSRALTGTLGERYLRNRSITVRPSALRFHARTPLGPVRLARFRPALIAAVTDDSGLLAVQRTFLDEKARRARDLEKARWMLGRPRSGAVRLATVDDELGIAEGVETAISAMTLLGIPVWAALGSERFPHIAIPGTVRRLILLPDNDRAGRLSVPLAEQAHAADSRLIETIWPWRALNDWNDVLRLEGREAGGGCGEQSDGQADPQREQYHADPTS